MERKVRGFTQVLLGAFNNVNYVSIKVIYLK